LTGKWAGRFFSAGLLEKAEDFLMITADAVGIVDPDPRFGTNGGGPSRELNVGRFLAYRVSRPSHVEREFKGGAF